MPYLLVEDFAAGIDLRKSALTSKPGTLRDLRNGLLTAGGEIEKRRTFTTLGVLPAGETHGLSFLGNQLVVFGTIDPPSVSPLPANVVYRQLVPGDATTILSILDTQIFNGLLYVVARMSDQSIRHFYDGTLVPDAQVQGIAVRSHKSKLYAVDGQNIRFSAILDPTDWTVGAGNGIIDITTEDSGATDLVGLEQYYNTLALFARTSVQIWAMDPDPARNTLVQVLGNVGLVATNAIARYGTGDVLFLSDTGIRSLRARDSSNAAALTDVGSPIDNLIQARRALLNAAAAEKINSIVDPLTGRVWIMWGQEIFVLSSFPNTKVSAWSRLETGYPIDAAVLGNSRIAIRSGEQLLIYGAAPAGLNPFNPNNPVGTGGSNFDATSVLAETPFFDAGTPAQAKDWTGIDVTCTGTWDVFVNPDPSSTRWTKIATITGSTWDAGRIPLDMRATRMAVRFVSSGIGAATLSSFALHFEGGETS
jgi:hypothetical protein